MSNEITLVINGIPTDFVRKDSIAAPVKIWARSDRANI